MTEADGNLGPRTGYEQKCGSVKPVIVSSYLPSVYKEM